MIYRKTLRVKRPTEKRVTLADFRGGINTREDERLLPFAYATLCYNYEGKSGALREYFGAEDLTFSNAAGKNEIVAFPSGTKIQNVWHFKKDDGGTFDDRLIFLTTDLQAYEMSLAVPSQPVAIRDLTFSAIPEAVNYRLNGKDVIVFSSAEDSMAVYDGQTVKRIATAPKITSMCMHYERLFAIVKGQPNSLWFSDNLDPTNWQVSSDGAGYVDMVDERGALLKVVSFLDYLYVFRNNGIARVTAYADQTQFSASQLFVSSGKIYPDTVTVCGDRILFLAEDGLYAFDGLSTTKVLQNLDLLFRNCDNTHAKGVFFNGKYYLALRLNYHDDRKIMCEKTDYVNNSVLQYDIAEGNVFLARGVDVCSLLALRTDRAGSLLLCFRDEFSGKVGRLTQSGKAFTKALPKCWQTCRTDFGSPERKKYVKRIYLLTHYDVTLEVECDGQIYSFDFSGKSEYSCRRVNLLGTTFQFRFYSDCDKAYLVRPVIVYDVA